MKVKNSNLPGGTYLSLFFLCCKIFKREPPISLDFLWDAKQDFHAYLSE